MNQTDRELLEKAAKAVGIEWDRIYWNPLTNDSDALRLAVRLNLTVKFDVVPDGAFVSVGADGGDEDKGRWDYEFLLKDPYAATRRAIVRAAAAIGEQA